MIIDFPEDIICFLDEVACQNLGNPGRVWYKLGTKNTIITNPEKISLIGMGIQAVNGNSLIHFPNFSKTYYFVDFLIRTRIENMVDAKTRRKLLDVINNPNLYEENIKETIRNESKNKKEFIEAMENCIYHETWDTSKIKKKVQNTIKKDDETNKHLIDYHQRENIVKNLHLSDVKNYLDNERRIVIILDNYPVHKANLAKQACEILNIVIIPLPPHSPKLNPIEQVWRTVKKKLSTMFIKTKEFLEFEFEKEYYNVVDHQSYYENWLKNYVIGYSPGKIQ